MFKLKFTGSKFFSLSLNLWTLIALVLLFKLATDNMYKIYFNVRYRDLPLQSINVGLGYSKQVPILRMINKNSPFFLLEMQHQENVVYQVDGSSEELIKFCLDKKCENSHVIHRPNDNRVFLLSTLIHSICKKGANGIYKIDDDILYTQSAISKCYDKCKINSCCFCSVIAGEKEDKGRESYKFPVGWFYYLNSASVNVLCKNFKETNEPEDMSIGQILTVNCLILETFDMSDYIKHRSLTTDSYGIELTKSHNHA
ncbi:hypothetical protein CONCODRAFT_7154 [Conidiobolus coronatus NRRL 28638]|uniref:Uncharacterized protein n=1 Tax=Conidiobolus coronatus (strain ATCC 28846 / CBS 209.66 / NRRL 28638) TaxID=796925 RepID=A0A137P5N5_CONC2|nr:hypothetical protein CONCODRAFT_7154 [Conidiobolus coronatus NRRL 28638]|eukprot:KXN70315.1 hypothetical protein CONCODRAFT_7154 [Conidiobolus coronatus NRRL 28638]